MSFFQKPVNILFTFPINKYIFDIGFNRTLFSLKIRSHVACNSLFSYKNMGDCKQGVSVKEVVSKINQFASSSLAESWDNVGLLVEPVTKKSVETILLTNDLTLEVMQESLDVKADMIISYHPPIFAPLKSVTTRNWKEKLIATCLENRIALYSPHTSFDAVKGGVNDWLCSAFSDWSDPNSIKPLSSSYTSPKFSYSVNIKITDLADVEYFYFTFNELENVCVSAVNSIDMNWYKCEFKVLEIHCTESSLVNVMQKLQDPDKKLNAEVLGVKKHEKVPIPQYGMGRICIFKEKRVSVK